MEIVGGSPAQCQAVDKTLATFGDFVAKTGVKRIEFKDTGLDAMGRHIRRDKQVNTGYTPLGSGLVVLSTKLDPVAMPRVLSHELGHEFMHHDGRDRLRDLFKRAHRKDLEGQNTGTRQAFMYFTDSPEEAAAEAISYALVPPDSQRANEDDKFVHVFPEMSALAREIVQDDSAMDSVHYGEEIEGWEQMGLEPGRRYRIAQDAEAQWCEGDGGLGKVSVEIANKLFPNGFDVSPHAPDTFEDLVKHYIKTGRMSVFSGASGKTIFGTKEENYAFRAWHDSVHIRLLAPFTEKGEHENYEEMSRVLLNRYGDMPKTRCMISVLKEEIDGQLQYSKEHHKKFPVNQRAFAEEYLNNPSAAVHGDFGKRNGFLRDEHAGIRHENFRPSKEAVRLAEKFDREHGQAIGHVAQDANSGAWKDEPRKPAGEKGGGEWTAGGGSWSAKIDRDQTSKNGVPSAMSDKEQKSLLHYRSNGYRSMNELTRNPKVYKNSQNREEVAEHVSNLDSLLSKSSLSKPMTVFRGLSQQPTELERLKLGGTFKFNGYQSGTWSDAGVRDYTGGLGGNGAILEMRLPAGARALDLDKTIPKHSFEHEVIVDRGQTWKLVGKSQDAKSKKPVYVIEMAAPGSGHMIDTGSGKGSLHDGGKHVAGTHVEGYSKHATWTADGRIHTTKVDDAVKALYEKQRVVLDQPREVSTLIEKLGKLAKKAKEAGEAAPEFNLCDVSVPGTNLFCAETKGIPRPKMPQIKDQEDFFKYLAKHGITAENAKEDPAYLRATQTELDAIKVARMMKKYREDPKQKRVLISSDNYILDGHHHWAGKIGVDAEDNKLDGDKLRIVRLSAPITTLLEHADKYGAPHSTATYSWNDTAKDEFNPSEPRVPKGSAGGGEWTSGGVGAGGHWLELHEEGTEFVSPNETENEQLSEAIKNIGSERMKRFVEASHDIDELFHAPEISIAKGIGAWSNGAEETTVQRLDPSVDYELGAAVTAAKALIAHQKAALWFEPGEGKNSLYEFEAPGADIQKIHAALLRDGVQFHTLIPSGDETKVYVYDEDGFGLDAVKKAAKSLGVSNVNRHVGRGEFIGSWYSREEGAKAFEQRIGRWIGSDRNRREGWRRLLDRWGNSRQAADAKKRDPEHTLTLGLSGDMVKSWVRFFREIMQRAAVGHSFSIEADRRESDDGGIHTGIDGDGADRIVSITLDGEDVTKEPAQDTAIVSMDYDPNEPRVPAGQPGGGEWTKGGTPHDVAAAHGYTKKAEQEVPGYTVYEHPSGEPLYVGENNWLAPSHEKQEGGKGLGVQSLHDYLNRRETMRRVAKGEIPHPALIEVGGDPWNQETAKRLADEQQKVHADLDKLVADAENGDKQVEVFNTEEENTGAEEYTPESWDELSSYIQDKTADKWKEDNFGSYKESKADYWSQSEMPGVIAVRNVAEEFNTGSDSEWAYEAYREFLEDWEGSHIPFDEDAIIDSLYIDEDDGSISFDDDMLDKMHPDTRPEDRPTLPGFVLAPASGLLTKEMRDGIIDTLKEKFEEKVEEYKDKLDPLDYVDDDMIQELLDSSWEEKSDDDKFEEAKTYDFVQPVEQEAPDEESGPVTVKAPETWDPLNTTSGTDYERTQAMAHYLFQHRAEQLFKERGIKLDYVDDIRRSDSRLWNAWKESSTSLGGKVLQMAIAEELGGRLNKSRLEANGDEIKAFLNNVVQGVGVYVGGYDGIKAMVRAKWEVTQYMLDKAGIHDMNVYRGLSLGSSSSPSAMGKIVNEGGFSALPDVKLERNGAASFTTDRKVANGWSKGSLNKITIRASVPRTAVVSVPAYGMNIHSEHEVVLAGTAWKGWDVWKGAAPSFESVPCCERDGKGPDDLTNALGKAAAKASGKDKQWDIDQSWGHAANQGYTYKGAWAGKDIFKKDEGDGEIKIMPNGSWNLLKSGKIVASGANNIELHNALVADQDDENAAASETATVNMGTEKAPKAKPGDSVKVVFKHATGFGFSPDKTDKWGPDVETYTHPTGASIAFNTEDGSWTLGGLHTDKGFETGSGVSELKTTLTKYHNQLDAPSASSATEIAAGKAGFKGGSGDPTHGWKYEHSSGAKLHVYEDGSWGMKLSDESGPELHGENAKDLENTLSLFTKFKKAA